MRRGALAGRRQRARDALRLPAEQAIPPAAPLGRRGQLDVARDLRGREAELLRAEARIERGEELAHALLLSARAASAARPIGSSIVALRSMASRAARNSALRRAQRRGISGRRREQICAALERLRRGDLDGAGRAAERPGPWQRPGPHDDVQPVEVVDQPHDRPRGRAQSGRAVGRREEHAVQRADRGVGRSDRLGVLLGRRRALPAQGVGGLGAQARGQCPAGSDRRARSGSGSARPEDRDRHERSRRGHAPAGQPVRDRRRRPGSDSGRMNASSSDVEARGKHRADDPAKSTQKATSAIAIAASQGSRDARVPTQTRTPPASASVACDCSRSRIGPLKSTSTSVAKDPKAANVATLRLPMTRSPSANSDGMTIAARAARRSAARSRSRVRSQRTKRGDGQLGSSSYDRDLAVRPRAWRCGRRRASSSLDLYLYLRVRFSGLRAGRGARRPPARSALLRGVGLHQLSGPAGPALSVDVLAFGHPRVATCRNRHMLVSTIRSVTYVLGR